MLLLALTLLSFTSCDSKKNNSSPEITKEPVEQVKIKAPEMDLHTATIMGNVEVIQQHILAGSDINIKEPSVGSSPLITAAVFGKTEAARTLIDAGADVNLKNNDGSTALHSAAFLCRTEIVKMLLENGADKDLRNNFGNTAFESVAIPFNDVIFIYDIFSKELGPLGIKLDYKQVEMTRPIIAEMLK